MHDLVTILYKPRPTMRRILERGSRAAWPLVLLAFCAGALGDFDAAQARSALASQRPIVFVLIAVSFVATALLSIGAFYLFGWAATHIGRFLEGSGTARDVRLALAWGLAPWIWSLLYRLPLAIYSFRTSARPQVVFGSNGVTFSPGMLAGGCAAAIVLLVLQLLVLAAWIAITSLTLAEAHRFSGLKGLGTLAATAAVPLVVALAIAFAVVM